MKKLSDGFKIVLGAAASNGGVMFAKELMRDLDVDPDGIIQGCNRYSGVHNVIMCQIMDDKVKMHSVRS